MPVVESEIGKTPLFHAVTFENKTDTIPRPFSMPWQDFASLMTQHDERATKDGPLWSPALYSNGTKRAITNVEAITAFVADLDHFEEWEPIQAKLDGYDYIVHSTFRHEPDNPRLRVIIRLVAPIPRESWHNVWATVNHRLFDGKLDTATKDEARAFYFPSCPPGALRVAQHYQGEALNPRELGLIIEAREFKRAEPIPTKIPYGTQHKRLVSLGGSMRRRGADVDEIEAALLVANRKRLEKPAPADHIRAIAESICSLYEPADSEDEYEESRLVSTIDTEPQHLVDVAHTFRQWLHLRDLGAVLVMLGAVAANRAAGDPVWLLLISPPGGGKTEIVMSIITLPKVYPVAVLTEAALLSGTPKKDLSAGASGGLLRRIGEFGIMVVKDFGGILSLNRDSRGPILAGLREVYDGSWTREVGSDGGKTLHWQGKCGLIGGATPAIDGHHAVMAALGERFCFYRLDETGRRDRADEALAHFGQEPEMRAALSKAVAGLFETLPSMPERADLNRAERDWLITLADLAVICRSGIERDYYGPSREILDIPGAEAPTRLVKVLAQLLGGLLHIGVNRRRAWVLVRRIALDSIPRIRKRALDYIYETPGNVITSAVAAHLGYPTNTMRRSLEDLAAYHMVTRDPGGRGNADHWQLSATCRTALTIVRSVPGIRNPLYNPKLSKTNMGYTSTFGGGDGQWAGQ